MAKVVLNDVVSSSNVTTINSNFDKIEDELNDKVLYRDNPEGEPNQMETDLDMNGSRIYNLPAPTLASEAARLQDVQNAIAGANTANLISVTPAGGLVSTNVQAALQELDSEVNNITNTQVASNANIASSKLGFTNEGSNIVSRTVESKLQETVSLFDYFTTAQIADYEARTAQTSFSTALNLTTAVQNAIYDSYAQGKNLYCPPGAARIEGTLEIPTNSVNYEDRGDVWTMYGQGASQNFVRTGYKGTAFISNTDAPILRYHQRRTMPTGGGLWRVLHIRFEQTLPEAIQPVVLLDTLTEYAEFAYNQIFQAGTGNGLEVTYQIKGEIHHNFVMNRDWVLGSASAVGVGINIPSSYGAGLLTLRKNSVRGFEWGYVIGNGTVNQSATLLEQNECSQCKNGVWIKAGTSACRILVPFFEGIQETCIKDDGTMTTVSGGQFFLGFTKGIESTAFTYGNTYEGNYIETGTKTPCTLIHVSSSGTSGGPNKTIRNNVLLWSASGGSIANVRGVLIEGVNPRITLQGNAFNPRGPWIGGAGTGAIDNQATGQGIHGFTVAKNGEREFPKLGQGAITLGRNETVLTQANVSGNVLTIGEGSWHEINATSAATVTSIAGGTESGRLLYLDCRSANMTFTDSATLLLNANTSFTGPGILVLLTQIISGTTFAREVSRTTL